MPLTFNLRHLERKPLHLQGELPPSDLDAENMDELILVRRPVHYDLSVEAMPGSVLVQGSLAVTLDCECARCLRKFEDPIELQPWAVDLPLTGPEKVAVIKDCVDLTPWIREDILLAFPQYPLCESDCRGLPQAPQHGRRGGAASNDEASSPWRELNKLKF